MPLVIIASSVNLDPTQGNGAGLLLKHASFIKSSSGLKYAEPLTLPLAEGIHRDGDQETKRAKRPRAILLTKTSTGV